MDYLTSYKTFYPMNIGDNLAELHTLAEDTTMFRDSSVEVRVLSPDTSTTDPIIDGITMTPASYSHTTAVYRVEVDINDVNWNI